MEKLALLIRLEAKPRKEDEVADFIKGALPLAQGEEQFNNWSAIFHFKNMMAFYTINCFTFKIEDMPIDYQIIIARSLTIR